MYIWKDPSGATPDMPCWPVNYNKWNVVCAQYMVENSTLMSYTGKHGEWSWAPMAYVPPAVNGYTYIWKVPLGISKIPTDHVVIQAEGYGPRADLFTPCPSIGGGPDGNGRYCAN